MERAEKEELKRREKEEDKVVEIQRRRVRGEEQGVNQEVTHETGAMDRLLLEGEPTACIVSK